MRSCFGFSQTSKLNALLEPSITFVAIQKENILGFARINLELLSKNSMVALQEKLMFNYNEIVIFEQVGCCRHFEKT